MLASKGNAGAFLEAAVVEIDSALESASRALAVAMYRNGSGSIGRIASGQTTATITLSDVESITNFAKGMTLVASTADGGGSVKAGTAVIQGVDRDEGTITFSAALNTLIGTIAANDYLFVQGNYDASIKGLQAWLPNVAPTSGDNFFGVDRSSDATRLAGIRFDGSAMPIEEALISAASRVAREGGKPTHCFMSYSKFADLQKALGTQVQRVDVSAKADIMFRGIVINGPRGAINVIPDQNCPNDRAFMLQLDMWKLYSLGKAPHISENDGLRMLREANADSLELRVSFYGNVACRKPGANVNIKL
jgi:hypothetical protein